MDVLKSALYNIQNPQNLICRKNLIYITWTGQDSAEENKSRQTQLKRLKYSIEKKNSYLRSIFLFLFRLLVANRVRILHLPNRLLLLFLVRIHIHDPHHLLLLLLLLFLVRIRIHDPHLLILLLLFLVCICILYRPHHLLLLHLRLLQSSLFIKVKTEILTF